MPIIDTGKTPVTNGRVYADSPIAIASACGMEGPGYLALSEATRLPTESKGIQQHCVARTLTFHPAMSCSCESRCQIPEPRP